VSGFAQCLRLRLHQQCESLGGFEGRHNAYNSKKFAVVVCKPPFGLEPASGLGLSELIKAIGGDDATCFLRETTVLSSDVKHRLPLGAGQLQRRFSITVLLSMTHTIAAVSVTLMSAALQI
jgi:hypothetical protein